MDHGNKGNVNILQHLCQESLQRNKTPQIQSQHPPPTFPFPSSQDNHSPEVGVYHFHVFFFFTFIIHVYNKNNINRVQKKWNPVKHDVTGLVKQRRGLEEDEGRCPWPVEVTQGTSYCRDG